MTFDTVVFESSAARNGLTAIAPVEAGSASGYNVVNTNYLRMKGAGAVFAGMCITAAVANLKSWAFNDPEEANQCRQKACARDVTSLLHPGSIWYGQYPFAKDSLLGAMADNTNTAQIEAVILAIGPTNPALSIGANPFPGAKPLAWTSATAAVAATWKKITPTYEDTLKPTQLYQIVGFQARAATLYAARLSFSMGPSIQFHPGIPGSISMATTAPVWGNFGQFLGQYPPDVEVFCSAADAAQLGTLYIVPVRWK